MQPHCRRTGEQSALDDLRSPVSDNERIGRLGARRAQYLTGWSTLLFDTKNRVDLLNDELEIYRRGVNDAPRPTTADLPPGFDNEENNWMHDHPKAYVIPMGQGQRSDPEAARLVRWLLANGIRVEQFERDYAYGSTTFEAGSYVVRMNQALRGLADTALGPGVNVSSRISILYAPPGAWSHRLPLGGRHGLDPRRRDLRSEDDAD